MNDLPCIYRSPDPVATAYCGCSGRYKPVHRCTHPCVNGYVTIHATPIKRKRLRLASGGTDDLPSFSPPTCVLCPYRPDASEELKSLVNKEPNPNPSQVVVWQT